MCFNKFWICFRDVPITNLVKRYVPTVRLNDEERKRISEEVQENSLRKIQK